MVAQVLGFVEPVVAQVLGNLATFSLGLVITVWPTHVHQCDVHSHCIRCRCAASTARTVSISCSHVRVIAKWSGHTVHPVSKISLQVDSCRTDQHLCSRASWLPYCGLWCIHIRKDKEQVVMMVLGTVATPVSTAKPLQLVRLSPESVQLRLLDYQHW